MRARPARGIAERGCGGGALRGTPSRRGKGPLKSEPKEVIDPIFFFHGGAYFTRVGDT